MIRSFLLSLLCTFGLLISGVLSISGCATTSPKTESINTLDKDTNIIGEWTYSVASPGGGNGGTFTISKSAEAYAGVIIAQGSPLPLENILLTDKTLSFSFRIGNGPVVRCSGEISGNEFSGSADSGPYGVFDMTATLSD